MSTYRYFTADLLTGTTLMELPLTGVSIDEELNEPGSMTAQLDLFATDAASAALKSATLPARTAIYVAADDTLLWGGILWKRRMRGHHLELVASGFLSYFSRVRISQTLTFTDVDQFDIARSLLQFALGRPGGNIGVELGQSGSGVLRTLTYDGPDRRAVLEAVHELADLANGFDVGIRVAYGDNRVPVKQLVMGYPQLGRPALGSPLLIEYPGAITDWDWPEEGDRMVTTAYVRGELTGAETGTNPIAPSVELTNQSLLTAGYPRLEEEYASPSSGTAGSDNLTEYAQSMLNQYGRPVTLPSFTIVSGGGYIYGPHPVEYAVGDWMRVRITDNEWLPPGPLGQPGVDVMMRVVKRGITINGGDGGETTSLTLSPTGT